MIFTSFWYNVSLDDETVYTRNFDAQNRSVFCPLKSIECFELWLEYIKKNYPNEHIYINCPPSPIEIESVIHLFDDNYEFVSETDFEINFGKKYHLRKIKNDYGYPDGVYYNYILSIKTAFLNKQDLFWIDTDCLVNDNFLGGPYQFLCNSISHEDIICDQFFYFIKYTRMAEINAFYDLIGAFEGMWNRYRQGRKRIIVEMAESGFYCYFCYGKTLAVSSCKIIHASSREKVVKFLEENPLESPCYRNILTKIKEKKIDGTKYIESF